MDDFGSFWLRHAAGVETFTGKHLVLIPFISGAVILLYYYTVQRPP